MTMSLLTLLTFLMSSAVLAPPALPDETVAMLNEASFEMVHQSTQTGYYIFKLSEEESWISIKLSSYPEGVSADDVMRNADRLSQRPPMSPETDRPPSSTSFNSSTTSRVPNSFPRSIFP